MKKMNNTEMFCLEKIAIDGWTTADYIVRKRWPKTQQAGLKAKTIGKYLQSLVECGYARKAGPLFTATDAGRDAAQSATQIDRPVMLGISSAARRKSPSAPARKTKAPPR